MVGFKPEITDAELITLAILQVLMDYPREAHWVRYARKHLRHLFPLMPAQPGYNKRLRKLGGQLTAPIRILTLDTDLWKQPVRIADSTPAACGRSRETANRSALAGWAAYGYCASHSRHYRGLHLHLITTIDGLPVAFAPASPKTPEHEILTDLFDLDTDSDQLLKHPGRPVLIADKGYRDTATENQLNQQNVTVIRPAYKNETPKPGRALHQNIESVNQTFKGQLDLERHGGRTITGVTTHVLQRILALTAAIRHNWHTGQPVLRSLTTYDHQTLGIDHLDLGFFAGGSIRASPSPAIW